MTNPVRDQKFENARTKIANGAVLPSRVWNDTSVWTASTPSQHTLLIGGRFADGQYRLDAALEVPTPAQPADSRHLIHLTRLADSEYAWDTDVEYAIGTVKARHVGSYVGTLIASAEGGGAGRTERELRAQFGATAPRTAAVLSQLFVVDSVGTAHLTDGSTLATYVVSINPAGVESRYPHFARYLRRYVQTARMQGGLSDSAGVGFLETSMSQGRIVFRVRTQGGRMVSLAGAARQMPDSLILTGRLTMRIRRFNVGFRNYRANFTIERSAHERAWTIVSRDEPEWVLPLVTEQLLRTPLRRPFQGEGALFRIGVRDDSAGGQTLLTRRLHLDVQESLILRFIGRLGAIAMGDYAGNVEREQNAWLRQVFDAVTADVRSLAADP